MCIISLLFWTFALKIHSSWRTEFSREPLSDKYLDSLVAKCSFIHFPQLFRCPSPHQLCLLFKRCNCARISLFCAVPYKNIAWCTFTARPHDILHSIAIKPGSDCTAMKSAVAWRIWTKRVTATPHQGPRSKNASKKGNISLLQCRGLVGRQAMHPTLKICASRM